MQRILPPHYPNSQATFGHRGSASARVRSGERKAEEGAMGWTDSWSRRAAGQAQCSKHTSSHPAPSPSVARFTAFGGSGQLTCCLSSSCPSRLITAEATHRHRPPFFYSGQHHFSPHSSGAHFLSTFLSLRTFYLYRLGCIPEENEDIRSRPVCKVRGAKPRPCNPDHCPPNREGYSDRRRRYEQTDKKTQATVKDDGGMFRQVILREGVRPP